MSNRKTATQLQDFQFKSQGENVTRSNSTYVTVGFSNDDLAEIEAMAKDQNVTRAKLIRDAALKAIGK